MSENPKEEVPIKFSDWRIDALAGAFRKRAEAIRKNTNTGYALDLASEFDALADEIENILRKP